MYSCSVFVLSFWEFSVLSNHNNNISQCCLYHCYASALKSVLPGLVNVLNCSNKSQIPVDRRRGGEGKTSRYHFHFYRKSGVKLKIESNFIDVTHYIEFVQYIGWLFLFLHYPREICSITISHHLSSLVLVNKLLHIHIFSFCSLKVQSVLKWPLCEFFGKFHRQI